MSFLLLEERTAEDYFHSTMTKIIPEAPASPALPGLREYLVEVLEKADIGNEKVERAMMRALISTPREWFLAEEVAHDAFENISLPIAFEQVSGRPSTVVRMISLLNIRQYDRILEIGCGSGYAAALMSALGGHVFAIESLKGLAQATRKVLDRRALQNVILTVADGAKGLAEHAPFDSILISTPWNEPGLLLSQLAPQGRLVMVQRTASGPGRLKVYTRSGDEFEEQQFESVGLDEL